MQVLGLVMESVADWQKAKSKRRNSHAWCHTGLWKYSTHPNYVGEWIFWCGTLLGGLTKWPSLASSSSRGRTRQLWFHWIWTTAAMCMGFAFISTVLKGAVATLDAAQYEKYAPRDGLFVEFAANMGVAGPRRHVYQQWWRNYWTARQERRLLQHAKARKTVPTAVLETEIPSINNTTIASAVTANNTLEEESGVETSQNTRKTGNKRRK